MSKVEVLLASMMTVLATGCPTHGPMGDLVATSKKTPPSEIVPPTATWTPASPMQLKRGGAVSLSEFASCHHLETGPERGSVRLLFTRALTVNNPLEGQEGWWLTLGPDGKEIRSKVGKGVGFAAATDAKGGAHVIYFDNLEESGDGRFVFARATDRGWTREPIDPAAIPFISSPRIAMDNGGSAHLAYLAAHPRDQDRERIVYATNTSGSWKRQALTEVIEAEPRLVGLAVGSEGRIYLSYLDQVTGALRFATRARQGSWSFSSLAGKANSATMAIDDHGTVHIAYSDKANGIACWSRSSSGGALSWKKTQVVSPPPRKKVALRHRREMGLFADSEGGVHLIFSDGMTLHYAVMRRPKGWVLRVLDRGEGAQAVKEQVLGCARSGPERCSRRVIVSGAGCFALNGKKELHVGYSLKEEYSYAAARSKPPMGSEVLLYRKFALP